MQRRQLLSTVGAIAALGLAGCAGSADDPSGGSGDSSRSPTETTPTDTATQTTTAEPAIELENQEFTVVDVGSGQQRDGAEVEFRTEANEVLVAGTIWGSDGCQTAHLAEAAYDDDEDRLSVAVATKEREDAGGACTQAIVEIDYEATFDFSNGTPGEVSVSHDGRGIASAAHETVAGGAGEE